VSYVSPAHDAPRRGVRAISRRRHQAPAGAQHVRGGGALGAQSTSVSGVIRAAGRLFHHAVGHVQFHAAAHAAVTAHRGDRLHAPSRPPSVGPWWRRLVSTLLDDGYARINSTYHRACGRREVAKAAGHCRSPRMDAVSRITTRTRPRRTPRSRAGSLSRTRETLGRRCGAAVRESAPPAAQRCRHRSRSLRRGHRR